MTTLNPGAVTSFVEPDDVEPKVMTEVTKGNMTEHLDHAKVFSVIEGYGQLTQRPIPWDVLTQCMYIARALGQSDLALKEGRLIERSVRAVITDLVRLGMVSVTSRGSSVTDWGREKVKEWNSHYTERRDAAVAALRDWGVAASN